MNKKILFIGVVLVVSVFVLVYVFMIDSPDTNDTQTNSKVTADATETKSQPKKGKKHRLRPFNRSIELPRWHLEKTSGDSQKDKVTPVRLEIDEAISNFTKEFTLPNGIQGVIYAERPAFPSSRNIKFGMDLVDAEGNPLSGKANVSLLFIRQGVQDSRRGGFSERIYKKRGHYESLSDNNDGFFSQPGTLKALAMIPENANVYNPGKITTVELNIETGIPVWMRGLPAGFFTPQGLEVRIMVSGSAKHDLFLAAELQDKNGQTLDIVSTWTPAAQTGGGYPTLVFVGIKPEQLPLFLVDTTLWYGPERKLADYWNTKKQIQIAQQ
jgi:hypothetical protein